MKQEIKIFEDLYMDESVGFIADRHHTTPQQLLRNYISGKISTKVYGPIETTISLEPNEIEILKGLFGLINNKKEQSYNNKEKGGTEILFTTKELTDIRQRLDSIVIPCERYPEEQERKTVL